MSENAWVYWKSEPQLWTVGFIDANGQKVPESDHDSSEKAADRCHWLNGGSSQTRKFYPFDHYQVDHCRRCVRAKECSQTESDMIMCKVCSYWKTGLEPEYQEIQKVLPRKRRRWPTWIGRRNG